MMVLVSTGDDDHAHGRQRHEQWYQLRPDEPHGHALLAQGREGRQPHRGPRDQVCTRPPSTVRVRTPRCHRLLAPVGVPSVRAARG